MFDLTQFGGVARPATPQVNAGQFTQGLGDFSSLQNFGPQAQLDTSGNIGLDVNANINNTQGFNGLDIAKLGIGGANALLGGYLGFKQFGLAKDQFNFQKQAFQKNFDARRQETNRNLEDRQRARVAANPNAESVESYLRRNGV